MPLHWNPENVPLLGPRVDEEGNVIQQPPSPDIFKWTTVSEWDWFKTKWLFWTRLLLGLYMLVILILDIVEEWTRGDDNGTSSSDRMKGFFFFLSNLSWTWNMIYYWITSYWTYLEWKNVDSAELSERFHNNMNILPWVFMWAFDHVPQGKRRFVRMLFSFYYTLVVTLPFVVTLVFWLVLVTNSSPFGSAQKFFCQINVHAINVVIALVEILLLNSLPPQEPIWVHIVMMIVFSASYIGWVCLGRAMAGFWPYRFVNPDWQGKKHVVTGVLSATGVGVTMLALQYGLHVGKKYFSKTYTVVRRDSLTTEPLN